MADFAPIEELRAVAIASPFVPAEWVAAHGFQPRRLGLAARQEGPDAPPGCCPYPQALLSELDRTRPRAALFAGTCDQVRRALEAWQLEACCPTFLLNFPHTWESPVSLRFYLGELERLGRFLVALGGVAPAPGVLARLMAAHDRVRRRLLAARPAMSGRAWSECVAEYLQRGDPEVRIPESPPAAGGPRLAVLGGPLWGAHLGLVGLLEGMGASVVLDGTDAGERAFPLPFDRRRLEEQPLLELAAAYFGIPDAFRRPNSQLYQWLERLLAERQVKGLVLARCLWCDSWHAEARRLREWSGLPMAEVEITGDTPAPERLHTRLEALVEALR